MTKEEMEKELAELEKEYRELGEEYAKASQEFDELSLYWEDDAEYDALEEKCNKALDAYLSAYKRFVRAREEMGLI